jgi:hypothetical protein
MFTRSQKTLMDVHLLWFDFLDRLLIIEQPTAVALRNKGNLRWSATVPKVGVQQLGGVSEDGRDKKGTTLVQGRCQQLRS